MVHPDIVDKQLKRVGARIDFWGKAEVRELSYTLMDNETIQVAVMGRYSGGFALLVTTDQRILLIDKKPLYLTVEDVRYDMVAEVDFRHQLIDATVTICTLNKQLRFTTSRHKTDLRQLTNYIQQRVSELRQHQQIMNNMMPQPQTAGINPYNKAPLLVRRRISPFDSARVA